MCSFSLKLCVSIVQEKYMLEMTYAVYVGKLNDENSFDLCDSISQR